MNFWKQLFGGGSRTITTSTVPQPEKAAARTPASARSGCELDRRQLSEWRYAPIGVSVRHPKGWPVEVRDGQVIIHPGDGRTIDGQIYEIGMTFTHGTRDDDGSQRDEDTASEFVQRLTTLTPDRVVCWRERGRAPSGQAVTWFAYTYSKSGCAMKAVCAVAVRSGTLYYLDVTGLVRLIDERLEEWKAIVRQMDIQ